MDRNKTRLWRGDLRKLVQAATSTHLHSTHLHGTPSDGAQSDDPGSHSAPDRSEQSQASAGTRFYTALAGSRQVPQLREVAARCTEDDSPPSRDQAQPAAAQAVIAKARSDQSGLPTGVSPQGAFQPLAQPIPAQRSPASGITRSGTHKLPNIPVKGTGDDPASPPGPPPGPPIGQLATVILKRPDVVVWPDGVPRPLLGNLLRRRGRAARPALVVLCGLLVGFGAGLWTAGRLGESPRAQLPRSPRPATEATASDAEPPPGALIRPHTHTHPTETAVDSEAGERTPRQPPRTQTMAARHNPDSPHNPNRPEQGTDLRDGGPQHTDSQRPRAAVDALVAGNLALALQRYRALAHAKPTEPAFAAAVQILEERAAQR